MARRPHPASSVRKRAFDLALTLPLLVVSAPLLVGLALLVRIKMGAPALFVQKRPGLHGRTITVHKLRTMIEAADESGIPLPDDARITPLGRWLRRTSLDELPQLFDVLRGDMSLVGPRPLLVKYLDRYSEHQARRHDARPGITGWAQVNGRNALDWEERLRMDVWYIDHWSVSLDVQIIYRTVLSVVTQRGITPSGRLTMSEFTGTEDGQ